MKIIFALSIALGICQAFQIPTSSSRRPLDTTSLSAHADAEVVGTERRAFLLGTLGAASVSLMGLVPQKANAVGVDYKAVSRDIADLIKKEPDWGPTMIRLAWHSSGTYDKKTKTGGSSGGTIRFKSELDHGGNAGLEGTAVKWLEPIYDKYAADGLSHADLYTLAGGTWGYYYLNVDLSKVTAILTLLRVLL